MIVLEDAKPNAHHASENAIKIVDRVVAKNATEHVLVNVIHAKDVQVRV